MNEDAGAAFSEAQWHELERQRNIYKYMMASVPVPPELLTPFPKNHQSNTNPDGKISLASHLNVSHFCQFVLVSCVLDLLLSCLMQLKAIMMVLECQVFYQCYLLVDTYRSGMFSIYADYKNLPLSMWMAVTVAVATGGSLQLGIASSASNNTADLEPWRCKRTDGKKWRCSRNVIPDQKYCERHTHKSRPRSRKHVESSHQSSHHNDIRTAKNDTSQLVRTYPQFYGQPISQIPVLSTLPSASSPYDHHRCFYLHSCSQSIQILPL